ncbi:MAG: glycosyltransferase [Nostoc sp.]
MISVITPVYNGEKFIEACLQNVIHQNFAEVEHIIVDGGSTDKTIDISKTTPINIPTSAGFLKKIGDNQMR